MKRTIGKGRARYSFILNPYCDVRLSKCPRCDRPTHPRKFALLIHVDTWGPLVLGKTGPYCSRCELIVAHQDELEAERQDGPPFMGGIGMPGRIVGGANLRTWPVVGNNLLRTVGHNAPVRILDSVEGDDGEEWYRANGLDTRTYLPVTLGYIHHSLVRLPRLRYTSPSPDRGDTPGRHFEADLREPALITAFEDGTPVWSTLTLKGTVSHRTPSGVHHILWRVPNETMTSERVYPPIPRDAPGGYYLTNVLWTQYFTSDGASIHYNYWSSNWGYAGSHGCLGIAYNEARFAWDWADVGTPVYVFT